MTRQDINIGSAANDGTGDTLRSAGSKINSNFQELYLQFGGDSDVLSSLITIKDSAGTGAIIFEGTSADDFETKLMATNPTTVDKTIQLPDATGTVVLKDTIDNLTNKTLTSPVLVTPQIDDTSNDHQYIFIPSELSADRNITIPALSSDDTMVFANNVQTLNNKTITSPKIGGGITDQAGAEIIKFTSVASAVNEIKVSNNITGNNPIISVDGDDTNVNLKLEGKGSGCVEVAKLAYTAATISTNGAAPASASLIIIESNTAIAISVADGTTTGEYKIFINEQAGIATITPATFNHDALSTDDITLNQYDSVTLVWSGSAWYISGGNSVVTVS
jgi:hypothetical protein